MKNSMKWLRILKKGLNRLSYSFESTDYASQYAYNLKNSYEKMLVRIQEEFEKLSEAQQKFELAQANAINNSKYASKQLTVTGNMAGVYPPDAETLQTAVVIVHEISEQKLEELKTQFNEELFSEWG